MTATISVSDSAPLWRGFEEHQVRLPFCTQCQEPHLPPGPVCPYCLSAQLEWRAASGAATLTSWVVERKKCFEAFDPPYIVAEVELAEGPRMPAQIDWSKVGQLSSGLHGRIEFNVAPNGLTLPKFVPGNDPAS